MVMPFYLYLRSSEHVRTWVEGGGPIPLGAASDYKGEKREGTQTPDENLIHESEADISGIVPLFSQMGIENVSIQNCIVGGERLPDIRDASYFEEDGRILCFSTQRDADICTRLGKEFCVEIQDMAILKNLIDQQTGINSIAGHCQYSADHQRNHFLKGEDDAWMYEFRLFWPTTRELTFMLPPGIGRPVELN